MALPPGAHYIRGTGRRLVTLADGSVVKRQTAENLEAQIRTRGTAQNEKQLRRMRAELKASPNYNRTLAEARERRERGDPRIPASDREIESLALAAKGSRDKSPDGPIAEYLTAIGRRTPGADYAVGDTPGTH